MKIFFRIILMALVYGIVSTLLKKFLWQDTDVASTKELVRTGIVALIVSTFLVLFSKKKVKKQSLESVKKEN